MSPAKRKLPKANKLIMPAIKNTFPNGVLFRSSIDIFNCLIPTFPNKNENPSKNINKIKAEIICILSPYIFKLNYAPFVFILKPY